MQSRQRLRLCLVGVNNADQGESSRLNITSKNTLSYKQARLQCALTQAMGRCPLVGFSSGCWSGASQALKKVTASRSLSNPSLGHYIRAPEAGRMRPEESLNALLHQGAQGAEFNSLSGHFPFAFNLAIMIVFSMSTFWVCGVFNQCKVADYNWLDVSGNLTSQNIAIRLAAMFKKSNLTFTADRPGSSF